MKKVPLYGSVGLPLGNGIHGFLSAKVSWIIDLVFSMAFPVSASCALNNKRSLSHNREGACWDWRCECGS